MKTELPTFLGCQGRPMEKDESLLFINLVMAQTNPKVTVTFGQDIADSFGPSGQILFGRLMMSKPNEVLLDTGLAAFLTILAKGNPGNLVMWAWTCRAMFRKVGFRQLTINDFTNEFPMGIPSEEEISKVWEAQKTADFRNNLDDARNWALE